MGDNFAYQSAGTAEGAPAPVTTGLAVPYSDEYRMSTGGGDALLSRLASTTGGRVVEDGRDAEGIREILRRAPGPASAGEGPWRALLLLGLLAFFLDIVVRRAAIPEGLRGRLASGLRGLRPERGPTWEELSTMVNTAREEERAKLRQRIAARTREAGIDEDLAAYLYIARLHGRRASQEEKKKE